MRSILALTTLCLSLSLQALPIEQQRLAVEQTLAQAPVCRELGDLYWEIGNARGVLAHGQRGQTISAERSIPLASASKWVFGAYVVERLGSSLDADAIQALQMRSGYDNLNPLSCTRRTTIAECWETRRNAQRNPRHIGVYSYDGGHAQLLAMRLGLGGLDSAALTRDLHQVLHGASAGIRYHSPQPAGGMHGSPADYGQFLQQLLAGRLRLSAQLGAPAVCTLPGHCAQAATSPAPYDWQYSLHYWIEAPQGDGAFSSAGALGFYPWIAADRQTYGIVARVAREAKAGMLSANCGAALRQAWATAQPALQSTTPTAAAREHPLLERWRQRHP